MIFNLFKSKNSWQHKDSNVRIAAVNEELAIDNPEDKALLTSLLNNDTSELVRRAVLLKFNNFDDYLRASHGNSNKAVKEFAFKQVQQILANKHPITLTISQKNYFFTTVTTNEPVDFSLFDKEYFNYNTEPGCRAVVTVKTIAPEISLKALLPE